MSDAGPAPRPVAGPTRSLHDVPGIRVGQVALGPTPDAPDGSTGVTAIVAPAGALGAVDVRGAAPGTRETDSLRATASGERVHAVLFVGRSVFGLAAADGAVRELEARGLGHVIEPLPEDAVDRPRPFERLVLPIVAAAVLFDFGHGDPEVRPTAEDGARAVAAALDGDASGRPAAGNVGAGTGASSGGIVAPRRKTGVGHASLVADVADGRLVVAALVVVNASGSVVHPDAGRPWALEGFGEPGDLPELDRIARARGRGERAQTTLAVVATNARATKAELARVATMAHDGLARAIRPLHAAVDGDAVFALAVPDAPDTPAVTAHAWSSASTSIVGALAADACTLAVLDAIAAAQDSGGLEAASWSEG